jgi:transketolase
MQLNKKGLKSSDSRCINYRKRILEISRKVSALHIGGSFSCVEIMDVLFSLIMSKKEKKFFVLSKGHASILQYVILEKQKIISKKILESYCTKKGILGVHPDIGNPGINASTGSLGHGLALSAGMALAEKDKSNVFYILISDGELQEGSTWEAVLAIGALNINNIILIIDNNNLQSFGYTNETHANLYPIEKKFRSFGWDSILCDGHNVSSIYKNIKKKKNNKPLALVAKTIKGYPISFMKNKAIWHYKSPSQDEYLKAIKELDEK